MNFKHIPYIALERTTTRKPRSVFLICFGSAVLLIAAYRFYTSSVHPSAAAQSQSSTFPATPACEIWPGWRPTIPSSFPADDTILSSLRLGATEVMSGISERGCTPAKERLGPFGHSSGDTQPDHPPWSEVTWGALQSDCATKHYGSQHADRAIPRRRLTRFAHETANGSDRYPQVDATTGRTAIVLRVWDAYEYSDNQLAWLRAMITELSLDTRGRFQVFILVNVKDNSIDLFEEDKYQEVWERSVPPEFQDTALLYNEAILREWYPKVGEYGAQDQMYQALQIFSQTFPEFDFVWQLEMDVRLTGNVARMLSNAGDWAREQPRKNLWERNGRWFIPGLWRDYASFSADVDEEFGNHEGIWGPHPYAKFYLNPQGPRPPVKRDSTWGIGEEAELITLSPLIDPVNTKWTYENTVHGFEPALNLPRRMAIVSMTRTSRRLLRLISSEQQSTGSWVVSESTPETWSLLHGLKAVYVPHLIAFNFKPQNASLEASGKELDKMLHKGPRWNLAGGEHAGLLWCNDVGLSEQRWLGASYFYWKGDAPRIWWEYTNGTCTYPLVLHPVKQD